MAWGRLLQQHDAIMRHTYVSQASNAVWHLDGLHKLIQYGFVIHGTVDGHDHVVSEYVLDYLLPIDTCAGCRVTCASTSNSASTVLSLFFNSVSEFGCPSRVRGDRGGENIDVAVWMIMHRGPRRGSFLWGS